MNLGVEEQAQRRKKERRRSSRKPKNAPQTSQPEVIRTDHQKIFQTKLIQVPQRKIGLIIGQNGKHIRELYKHTHCDIILPKQTKKKQDEEPLLEPEQYDMDPTGYYYVYDAYNDTVETNMNFAEPPKDQEDEKQNKNTNEDKEKEEKDKEDEEDPDRLVEVKLRGTPEETRDAALEINFMIKHGRLMLDHERSGDKRKKNLVTHRGKQYEVKNDDDILAEDIRVPSKICGMLIGGRGQRVKELAEQTGAEIWVDWDRESHMEAGVSTVHLKGTRYSVEFAKEEIRGIQKLFERGSNCLRFEIPAFCSKDLFGENGANLKMLQKQYNVSINVKNYRNERGSIRIGTEFQTIQRTLMIILVGQEEDQMACKKGIDKLLGTFVRCGECKYINKEDDGHKDKDGYNWYCKRCWDEFNGVSSVQDVSNRMQNVHLDSSPPRSPQQKSGQRLVGRKPPQKNRPQGGNSGYQNNYGGSQYPRSKQKW